MNKIKKFCEDSFFWFKERPSRVFALYAIMLVIVVLVATTILLINNAINQKNKVVKFSDIGIQMDYVEINAPQTEYKLRFSVYNNAKSDLNFNSNAFSLTLSNYSTLYPLNYEEFNVAANSFSYITLYFMYDSSMPERLDMSLSQGMLSSEIKNYHIRNAPEEPTPEFSYVTPSPTENPYYRNEYDSLIKKYIDFIDRGEVAYREVKELSISIPEADFTKFEYFEDEPQQEYYEGEGEYYYETCYNIDPSTLKAGNTEVKCKRYEVVNTFYSQDKMLYHNLYYTIYVDSVGEVILGNLSDSVNYEQEVIKVGNIDATMHMFTPKDPEYDHWVKVYYTFKASNGKILTVYMYADTYSGQMEEKDEELLMRFAVEWVKSIK